MINEAEIKRRFKNLISTTQLLKRIAQYGYQGDYTEQALYQLLDKYGIKPKAKRGGKSYFNKKNACTCIERHIFELKELAERLSQQNNPKEEPEWNVGYGRNDMSVESRKQLANDGVFGADENELYTNESVFNFKGIVNTILNEIKIGNDSLKNAHIALQNIFNVKPKYAEDGKYVYVKLETRRTYQYITIYEEDKDHVLINTGMYEGAYVVPNTLEDIEHFLKLYMKSGEPSNNAIEFSIYRKNNK